MFERQPHNLNSDGFAYLYLHSDAIAERLVELLSNRPVLQPRIKE
jgi:hypothetical protein